MNDQPECVFEKVNMFKVPVQYMDPKVGGILEAIIPRNNRVVKAILDVVVVHHVTIVKTDVGS